MSKPIKLTEELRERILQDLREKLRVAKSSDGKFHYDFNFSDLSDRRTRLYFTPTAWIKMTNLVRYYSSEVGWHGRARRVEDGFLVDDIYVYPQKVTGSTVDTDEDKLGEWFAAMDPDVFHAIRFHGHSHVNFAPSPSATDISHRAKYLDMLQEGDFYIFFIINKKDAFTVSIYDLADNVMYETKDVDVLLTDVADDTLSFIEDTESMVQADRTAFSAPKAAKTPEPLKYAKKKKESGKPQKEKDAFTFWDDPEEAEAAARDWLMYS